jgi:hypothetical protein
LGYDTKLQHFLTLKTDHKKDSIWSWIWKNNEQTLLSPPWALNTHQKKKKLQHEYFKHDSLLLPMQPGYKDDKSVWKQNCNCSLDQKVPFTLNNMTFFYGKPYVRIY